MNVTIHDNRQLDETLIINQTLSSCNLQAKCTSITTPTAHNRKGGKVQMCIIGGTPPFTKTCIEQPTSIQVSRQKVGSRVIEFSELSEGSYSFFIEDSLGMRFDTIVIIEPNIMSSTIAKTQFETSKSNLKDQIKARNNDCNKLKKRQGIIRFTTAAITVVATVITQITGSDIANISGGAVAIGGMYVSEHANDKTIQQMEKEIARLEAILNLYQSFPETNFESPNWNIEKQLEYEALMAKIREAEKIKPDNG
jgi:hypothetical protein